MSNAMAEALKEARQFILAPAEDLLWGVVHRIDAALAAPASPAPVAVSVKAKPLEWLDIHQARSNEDPNTEVVGWEAEVNGFGLSYVVELTGGGASMRDPDYDEKNFDTIEAAKAAAQADFNARILSSIIPATKEGLLPAVEVHPADTLPSGPAHLVSKAYVHEGCAIALYGTNDKLIGWIDTHEWVKGRIYRHHFLSQETDTEVKP